MDRTFTTEIFVSDVKIVVVSSMNHSRQQRLFVIKELFYMVALHKYLTLFILRLWHPLLLYGNEIYIKTENNFDFTMIMIPLHCVLVGVHKRLRVSVTSHMLYNVHTCIIAFEHFRYSLQCT